MRILVYPADMTGCGYFRLIWPALAIKKQYPDWDVRIIPPSERDGAFTANMEGDTVMRVNLPIEPDVVVMQRVTHGHLAQAVGVMRRQGIAVVVDMDDDLSTIHPKHPAWITLHPHKNPKMVQKRALMHNWHNAAEACKSATLVTVSSDALLKRYAAHGRGRVLYNCVPEGYLGITHVDSPLIGWGGAVQSHPDDLDVLGTAMQRVVREGATFKSVGPVGGVQAALRLPSEPLTTGPVSMEQWPEALAQLGIGIAPLTESAFNSAKSYLKALEYAALGVVPVMSPSPEYMRFHKLTDVGFIARNDRQWYRHLSTLTKNESLRLEQSLAGRNAATTMTIEKNAWLWAEAWSKAAASR